MKPRHGYLFIALLPLIVVGVMALALLSRHPVSPLKRYAPCVALTAGPSKLYACSNRRGYMKQNGDWTDVGPLSPVPPVPQG